MNPELRRNLVSSTVGFDLQRTPTNLPSSFSLLSTVYVPLNITACKLSELMSERITRYPNGCSIFEEMVELPSLPMPPPTQNNAPIDERNLKPPTPFFHVKNRSDANSQGFQKACESMPTVLIRGLTSVCDMKLSLFTTKALMESAPAGTVKIWKPCSINNQSSEYQLDHRYTTVQNFACFQSETFEVQCAKAGKEEKDSRIRRIVEEFRKEKTVLREPANIEPAVETTVMDNELLKLPDFFRLLSERNMLSYLGYKVRSLNTAKIRMNIAGVRTPVSQGANNLPLVNINIGPGDCQWFVCPYEYSGAFYNLCERDGVDFLKGYFWPNVEALYDEKIPVYRFIQKPGDLVLIGSGSIYWMQAIGCCNNIYYNVGPLNHNQLTMTIHRYEWNKIQRVKSLVPPQHLAWQLAKSMKFIDMSVQTLLREVLIRSFSFGMIVESFVTSNGHSIEYVPRQERESAHYCTVCEVEVFNILFLKTSSGMTFVYCAYCARECGLSNFEVIRQFTQNELEQRLDRINLVPPAQAARPL